MHAALIASQLFVPICILLITVSQIVKAVATWKLYRLLKSDSN